MLMVRWPSFRQPLAACREGLLLFGKQTCSTEDHGVQD